MFRLTRWTGLAIFLFATAGCASTMTVSSHVERGLDLSKYKTWDWGPADALPAGDSRLDKNSSFHDQVQGAVEKQMAAKGLTRPASGPFDLLLHYHASVSQRMNVGAIDRGHGYCQGGDCLGDVLEYEAGTLVLDIVDARTNKVIWRGWAQDSFDRALDNDDRLSRTINEAVPRILKSFRAGS